MCMVIIYLLEEAVVRENWDNIEHTLYFGLYLLCTHLKFLCQMQEGWGWIYRRGKMSKKIWIAISLWVLEY